MQKRIRDSGDHLHLINKITLITGTTLSPVTTSRRSRPHTDFPLNHFIISALREPKASSESGFQRTAIMFLKVPLMRIKCSVKLYATLPREPLKNIFSLACLTLRSEICRYAHTSVPVHVNCNKCLHTKTRKMVIPKLERRCGLTEKSLFSEILKRVRAKFQKFTMSKRQTGKISRKRTSAENAWEKITCLPSEKKKERKFEITHFWDWYIFI